MQASCSTFLHGCETAGVAVGHCSLTFVAFANFINLLRSSQKLLPLHPDPQPPGRVRVTLDQSIPNDYLPYWVST